MSKTAQRKREYFNQGKADFELYGEQFEPVCRKGHPLNRAYRKGYRYAQNNKELSVNNTLLQCIRVRFGMASA